MNADEESASLICVNLRSSAVPIDSLLRVLRVSAVRYSVGLFARSSSQDVSSGKELTMRKTILSACAVAVLSLVSSARAADTQTVEAGGVKFEVQTIDKSLKVGYAVRIANMNADKKPDIVVCDAERVIWFENPT